MKSKNEHRSFERWSKYKKNEYGLDEFLNLDSLDGESVVSINFNNVYLDLLVRINKYAPIVTLFHGAVPRPDGFKLPVFSGLNIVDNSYSRVLVSDSSLLESESLTLSWFCGSERLKLQEILPLVFDKIFKLSLPSKKIFAGGSGGGFASLYYASFYKDSFVIASNPQTDITRYYQNHVKKYANYAWGCDVDQLEKKIAHKLDDIYKYHFNTVFYVQNNSDFFHLKNHCRPFLKALASDEINEDKDCLINDCFYFKSAYWGDGHVGPPPVYWKILIDYLASYTGDREKVFTSKEFAFFLAKADGAYISDLEERVFLNFDKGDYSKAANLIERYFKCVVKPTAEMCLLSLKVFFKLGDEAKIKLFYSKSKLHYPDGWALVYYYSVYVSKFGCSNEAIEELEKLQISFKEKMPAPAHDLLLKLKKNCC